MTSTVRGCFFLLEMWGQNHVCYNCVIHGWSRVIHLLHIPVCNHKPYTLSCLVHLLLVLANGKESLASENKMEGGGKSLCSGWFYQGFCLVSIHIMLSKDVAKYVPINFNVSLLV